MKEVEEICDRVAILCRGKLVALDSPMKLKASISGSNFLEVSFPQVPAGWEDRMKGLPEVESVSSHDNVFRIATRNGPTTTMALLEAAAQMNLPVNALSAQSTTLDDVFVHYTGRQLRDALQEASAKESPMMMRRG